MKKLASVAIAVMPGGLIILGAFIVFRYLFKFYLKRRGAGALD